MVRLMRKLRTSKSQTKRAQGQERKPDDKQHHAAPETDGPRNFYKEDESSDSVEHAGRANVMLTARPPD